MRKDHNATELYLRWAAVLGDWMVCNPTDRGAIKFTRAEAPARPTERYWTVTLEGKLGSGPLDQYAMHSTCVLAATAEDAERIALAQENVEPITELKVLFTRPS